MIDTIRLEVKGISPADMEKIKLSLSTHYTVCNKDGVICRQITRGQLRGSWDYNVRIFVRDFIYQSVETEAPFIKLGNPLKRKRYSIKRTVKKTIVVDCPEYLVIEFSLPKWTEGHNLLNSDLSQDILRLTQFRKWLCVRFDCLLPPLDSWDVVRVDMGRNYALFHFDAVKNFLDIFSTLRYPRRKKPSVFETSIKWHGKTTIKLYAKGPEFKVHDFQRLKRIYEKEKLNHLREYADEILRFEIEFRKEKLKQLNIHNIRDLFETRNDWGGIMMNEYKKLTNGATNSKVYNYQDAMRVIDDNWEPGNKISKEAAGNIWVSISTQGLTFANKIHGRDKVKRARKFFNNIGLNCISNFLETEIQFDCKKIDIGNFYSDDTKKSKELARIIPFRNDVTSEKYSRLVVGL